HSGDRDRKGRTPAGGGPGDQGDGNGPGFAGHRRIGRQARGPAGLRSIRPEFRRPVSANPGAARRAVRSLRGPKRPKLTLPPPDEKSAQARSRVSTAAFSQRDSRFGCADLRRIAEALYRPANPGSTMEMTALHAPDGPLTIAAL